MLVYRNRKKEGMGGDGKSRGATKEEVDCLSVRNSSLVAVELSDRSRQGRGGIVIDSGWRGWDLILGKGLRPDGRLDSKMMYCLKNGRDKLERV